MQKKRPTVTGQRIEEELKRNKMTQGDLAKQIYTDPTTVNKYVNGSRHPDRRVINDIASVFEIRPEYLSGIDNYRTEDDYILAVEGKDAYSKKIKVDIERSAHVIFNHLGVSIDTVNAGKSTLFDIVRLQDDENNIYYITGEQREQIIASFVPVLRSHVLEMVKLLNYRATGLKDAFEGHIEQHPEYDTRPSEDIITEAEVIREQLKQHGVIYRYDPMQRKMIPEEQSEEGEET